jgi:hypothetical protein
MLQSLLEEGIKYSSKVEERRDLDERKEEKRKGARIKYGGRQETSSEGLKNEWKCIALGLGGRAAKTSRKSQRPGF